MKKPQPARQEVFEKSSFLILVTLKSGIEEQPQENGEIDRQKICAKILNSINRVNEAKGIVAG